MKTLIFLLLFLFQSLQGNQIHNQQALSHFDKIVIYQFAKVGSQSLLELFGQITKETPIEPVLNLPIKGKAIHSHSDEVIKILMEEGDNILVINIVRNLFDRNLSNFFHRLRATDRLSSSLIDFDALFEEFKAYNLRLSKGLATWYDKFAELFQIDLFKRPFDHKRKFILLKSEKVTLLIIRFEDIEQWPQIFEQTLNLRNITIPRLNTMGHPFYKEFKKEYRFSKEEIDLICSINFMKFFYKSQEMTKFSNARN